MESSSTDPFELSGGALCLDFANTWEDRGRPETEKLHGYRDLLAFGRQAGMLKPRTAEAVEELARGDPAAAERVYREATELREALYRLFSARAASRHVEPDDLERLSSVLAASAPRLRLVPAGESFVWAWAGLDDAPEAVLGPIARSAAELLTGGDLDRVRECDGDACTWLFLDHSRNRSRRWCSMETCGNRAKVRRHYHRARTAEEPQG